MREVSQNCSHAILENLLAKIPKVTDLDLRRQPSSLNSISQNLTPCIQLGHCLNNPTRMSAAQSMMLYLCSLDSNAFSSLSHGGHSNTHKGKCPLYYVLICI